MSNKKLIKIRHLFIRTFVILIFIISQISGTLPPKVPLYLHGIMSSASQMCTLVLYTDKKVADGEDEFDLFSPADYVSVIYTKIPFLTATGSSETGFKDLNYWNFHQLKQISCTSFVIIKPMSLSQVFQCMVKSGYGFYNDHEAVTSHLQYFILVDKLFQFKTVEVSINSDAYTEVDEHFMVSAPIIFLTCDEMSVKMDLYCPLCSLSKYVSLYPPEIKSLHDLHRHNSINSQAHGSKLIIQSNEFYAVDLARPECRKESYKMYKNCYYDGPVMSIMQQQLNISDVMLIDAFQDSYTPHPNVCIGCFYDTDEDISEFITSKSSHHIQLQTEEIKFLYCVTQEEYMSPGLDVFSKPFDKYVWICFLISSVGFAISNRSIHHGFDFIWGALAQSFQMKWSRSNLLSWLLLGLIIITNGYQGVITTDVIAPPKPHVMNAKELLDKGYRLLSPYKSYSESVLLRFKHVMLKMNVTPSLDLFLELPGYEYLATPNIFETMAERKGITHFFQWAIDYTVDIFENGSSMRNITCFLCPTYLDTYQVHWFFRFFLAARLRNIFERVKHSGIYNYWTMSFFENVVYFHRGSFSGRSSIVVLTLYSAIKYVFYGHILGSLISISVFLMEKSMHSRLRCQRE